MKISKASKTHLVIGLILILISLTIGIISFWIYEKYFALLAYFFGTWGGVEIGRYIESLITRKEK
jgi:hypothetical protein